LEDQKNRVYVTWLNEQGLECRSVGPSSKCFCGHKFRDHDAGNKQKKVFCKMARCRCKLFEYIPIRGSQDLKCHCKHSYKMHNISTRTCNKQHPVTKNKCCCDGFFSSFGCSCGQPFSSHRTLFESRAERQRAGKRVDNLAMGTGAGCPAMGGVTSFSSLIDGIDRLAIQQNAPSMNDLRLQFMRPMNRMKWQFMPRNTRRTRNRIVEHPSSSWIRHCKFMALGRVRSTSHWMRTCSRSEWPITTKI